MNRDNTDSVQMCQQYELLISKSPAVIYLYTLNREKTVEITFISNNIENLLGYSPLHFVGSFNNLIEKVHPQDKKTFSASFQNPGESGKITVSDYRFQDGQNEYHWLHDQKHPVEMPDGTVQVIGSFYDVSEQKRNEERLNLVIEGTNIGLWDWNIQTGKTVFNKRWAEMVGYTLEELMPTTIETWAALAHPEDLEISNTLIEQHIRGEIPFYDADLRMKHKRGHWIWVHDRGKIVEWTNDGKPQRMTGTHSDITTRKEHTQLLQREEEKLRSIIQTSLDGFFIVDTKGNFIDTNDSYCSMIGYSRDELLTLSLSSVEAIEDPEETAKHIEKIIKEGSDRFSTKHQTRSGTILDLEVSVNFLNTPEGGNFVSFVRDITEKLKAEKEILESRQQLEEISIRDPLTGIFNRRHFHERLEEACKKHDRTKDNFSLAIIDIDFFKKVNDTYGHRAGDFILIEFTKILRKRIREYDILGRYGGEEFIILFNSMEKAIASSAMDRILEEVRKKEFTYEGNTITITFSCGISEIKETASSSIEKPVWADRLIELADKRLYRAKREGRNRIVSA